MSKTLDSAEGMQKVAKLIVNISMIFSTVFPARFSSSVFGSSVPSTTALSLDPLINRFSEVDLMIDAVALPGDVQKFFNGDYSKEIAESKWCSIAKNLTLFTADIGGGLLFLAEFSLINLGEMASTIGSTKIFGKTLLSFIPNLSLMTVTNGALLVGCAFGAADACGRIALGETKGYIDLLWYVSEVALKSLFFTGCTNPLALGVVGAVAAYTGIQSLLWDEPKLESKKPVLSLPVQNLIKV